MMEARPVCVLLHGALGSSAQMDPLARLLSATHRVVTYTFPGHGGDEVPEGGYRMTHLRSALSGFLHETFSEPVQVFGYSMGGYVAASLSLSDSHLIHSLITLGTKWTWSPEIAASEIKMLEPALIAEKVPALASLLSERHAPQPWQEVIQATKAMMIDLGNHPLLTDDDLGGIPIPVTILRGSEDKMVHADESQHVASLLPFGRYREVEAQKHPFEQFNHSLLLPFLFPGP